MGKHRKEMSLWRVDAVRFGRDGMGWASEEGLTFSSVHCSDKKLGLGLGLGLNLGLPKTTCIIRSI